MCGIVGAVANGNVVPVLLDGLLHLEYRGYDSAGLVVTCNGLHRLRTTGRVTELQKLANKKMLMVLPALRIPVGQRMARLPSATHIHIFLERWNHPPGLPLCITASLKITKSCVSACKPRGMSLFPKPIPK